MAVFTEIIVAAFSAFVADAGEIQLAAAIAGIGDMWTLDHLAEQHNLIVVSGEHIDDAPVRINLGSLEEDFFHGKETAVLDRIKKHLLEAPKDTVSMVLIEAPDILQIVSIKDQNHRDMVHGRKSVYRYLFQCFFKDQDRIFFHVVVKTVHTPPTFYDDASIDGIMALEE